MKYTLYLRTNKVNGMQYVGQTSDFKQRERDWKCFKKKYSNKYISKDRDKYGLDNWTVQVLTESDNREDAWELERRFIKNFNTLYPNGYNLSIGGAGNSGCEGFWKGKQRSSQTKQKMSEAKSKKQVYQYTLDGKLVAIWPSTHECGRNGYNQGHISSCCKNKYSRQGNNIYKGYIWKYA